jgi:hypothetical protein
MELRSLIVGPFHSIDTGNKKDEGQSIKEKIPKLHGIEQVPMS